MITDVLQQVLDNLKSQYEKLGEPYIRTHSGINFTIFNPKPEMIEIEDIAHSLSHLCRYGGHANTFYSVASHSIIASYLVAPEFALDALCHDMGEAYIGDCVTPIKHQMPMFIAIEDKIYEVIAKKFGLRFPIPAEVHKIDTEMIGYEWDFFMEKIPNPTLQEFYKKNFLNTSIENTKKEYIERFNFLLEKGYHLKH